MEFNNKVLTVLHIGGVDVWITESIFNTWIIMLALTVFAVIVRIKLSRFKDVPSGFQNFVELIVDSMDNFVKGSMGPEYAHFGNYFFGLFTLIICQNLSGLVGLHPPTTDLATTAAFAINTFLLIHIMGITKSKSHYFKEYFEPFPLFFPIHLVGELAKPVSLSFRLFGNILGGSIIIGLIYAMFPWFLKIGVPAPLHFYFDTFAGSLQAYIFCVLSMTFIREKMPEIE